MAQHTARHSAAVLTSWLNSLGLPSRAGCTQFPVGETELHRAFQDGHTLVELLHVLVPSAEAQLTAGVHKRSASSALAVANIELGLRLVWQANPVARNMPTALELYAATSRETVLRFVSELLAMYAERPAQRRAATVLGWADSALHFYGRGLSRPSLAPGFRTLPNDFRSGVSMACLLHHVTQVSGELGPNLSQVYWEPEGAFEHEQNFVLIVPLLARCAPARALVASLASEESAALVLVQLHALWRGPVQWDAPLSPSSLFAGGHTPVRHAGTRTS
ncbi:hypothetical protein T492DRAFT_892905 [Pavlovales sp. CCMP2436]|nr:hypothetical protein T492DRAFT_892905 [Pavlovales sp. CCMP2436]